MFIGEPSRLFQMVSTANMRIYFETAKIIIKKIVLTSDFQWQDDL